MPAFSEQKVNVAVDSRAKLDVSSTHITSADWMHLAPVYYRHMIPGETIKGSGNVLSRMAPVAVPTYGRCRMNLRAFFVPFRTIMPNWNEFISDTIGSNYTGSSLIGLSPTIANGQFIDVFTVINSLFGNALCTVYTGTGEYDFMHNNVKYRLTYWGLHVMKVLNSLGYRVVFGTKGAFDWSALPLLAYAKVYCDWYANQAYLDSVAYLGLQQYFKFNDPTSNLQLTASDVINILSFCFYIIYDSGSDVYVNAWDNPMSPNQGNYSGISGGDVSAFTLGSTPTANAGFRVVLDSNGTPYMEQSAATSTSIGTEYLHAFLKSATDYVKRNQLSGALAIDRFLARFGINLDSAKANRSIYVSAQSIDFDFGSVMSNANTASSGSNLGDYAGVGIGKGQLEFDFHADEFGLFIITSSIVPHGSLVQGYDRNNLHVGKLDFFTPEFDNLGCQAIQKGEVYVSKNDTYTTGDMSLYQGLFGFAPRYYEYKQGRDFVTGLMASKASMIGCDSWYLSRIFDDSSFGSSGTSADLVHSLNFTRGIDAGKYNRIFNATTEQLDNFYLVYHFGVQSSAPCKSLFDTYDFDDAGKKIGMNGNNAKVN